MTFLLNNEVVLTAVIFGVILGLIVLVVTVEYQHDVLRDKIIERACKKFGEEKRAELVDVVDDLLGPEIRSLCALQDDDFYEEIASKFKS